MATYNNIRRIYLVTLLCMIGILQCITARSPPADLMVGSQVLGAKSLKASGKWKRLRSFPIDVSEKQQASTATESSTDTHSNDKVESHWTQYVAECNMPTDLGVFKMRSYVYSSRSQQLEPIVMVSGDVRNKENVLVRVHDQCFTSEVFGSKRCDCREQLKESLRLIKEQGGIVIYLQQEGRGIGIANKVAAYALQDRGFDTVDANTHLGFKDELREYQAVPDILRDLNIQSIKLMTNNPYKIKQLEELGVKISERVPLQVKANEFNSKYLQSKRNKMNHFLAEDIVQSAVSVAERVTTAVAHPAAAAVVTTSPGEEVVPHEAEDLSQEERLKGYALGRQTVVDAIKAVGEGKIVVVVDDADRENEGDLIMAAELATPEAVGFIVRYTSGVLCVSLEDDRLKELALPPMVVNNEDPKQTAYAVSTDYKHGTTTGISAYDRALTFRKLVDPQAKKEDFQRPGHVFPLRYKEGGVLSRKGHTEASLDLARLAGCRPGGILAEVVHDDGSMMRLPALREMAKTHNLVLTSVQDIKAYRQETETTP